MKRWLGSELEYFQYRTSYLDAARSGYRELTEVGWYLEDYHLLQGSRTEEFNGAYRRHLAASGVPVESTKGEFGRGQHELNIRYAPVLEMADRHLVLKQAVKEISDQIGCSATFMAKPDAAQAGSSCHLHFSLWTAGNGEFANAFPGDRDLSGIACSDLFRWFLGGWMRYVPEMMVCYAPTVNSYKRFQAGSWAPTALAWSPDNRTAGFRVVGRGPSLRIECRIAGADVNPYLAYAAVIASGLAGIEQQIEPPPAYIGDVYAAADEQMLPGSLGEAVRIFRRQRPGAFGIRRGGGRSLRPFFHDRGGSIPKCRDRLGARALLRADIVTTEQFSHGKPVKRSKTQSRTKRPHSSKRAFENSPKLPS